MFAIQRSSRNVSPLIRNYAAKLRNTITAGKPCDTKWQAFSSQHPLEPMFDIESFQKALSEHAKPIAQSLIKDGYYCTTTSFSMLPKMTIQAMRQQSINLREEGRLEQSWSERIDSATGAVTRFDKEGVFACEPDGGDYETAPDLVTYMSVLLQTLPELLNASCESENEREHVESFGLSVSSFNAKLAVTSPGGSVYPLHIDNPQGLSVGDTRKLTCILYLNPDYQEGDGGELRIYHHIETDTTGNDAFVDVTPEGGRIVLFWSDEIPHEVLPTAPDADSSNDALDRWALTVWIPTDNLQTIHNPKSKFSSLGDNTFQ